jgi:ribonuclease HI
MSDTWTIHIDGGARGNPGPAACASVIARPGAAPLEVAARLGEATNNVAEYTALVRALERAADLGGRTLSIFSDSELLVKQITGEYRVKNADLRVLFDQAQALIRRFEKVTLQHVRREQNRRADALCNQALDGKPGGAAKGKAPKAGREMLVHDDAIDCLRTAATAWARGNATDPPPEAVWEQLWSILEEARVVK